ncbi:MAG: CHAD domain-containing protein [Epsilonproteobacteria bacterium]|nr:CHAD domain-containing protein [Campylobacterota bacterium]
MELIKKYIKKQDAKTLHKLRISCRKKLAALQKKGLGEKGREQILKNSSKLRDTDVLLKICEDKKILKFLKRRRKKLNKTFLKTLKRIKFEKYRLKHHNVIDKQSCKNVMSELFLAKSDKELHKLRIRIKNCRYAYKKYEKEFKKIQKLLGKAHDYYKCEKLSKKFSSEVLKPYIKKRKFILKAEKARQKALKKL